MRKVSDPVDHPDKYSVMDVDQTTNILIDNLSQVRTYSTLDETVLTEPGVVNFDDPKAAKALAPLGSVDDNGNPLGKSAWKDKDTNKMQAVIIAGDADGRPGMRYQHALRLCKALGFECNRSKAMYVAMKEYRDVCGDYTDASRWNRTASEFKTDNYRRGCAFAHRVALEQIAVAENNTRRIIFEDDIVSPYETQQHGDPEYKENAARSRVDIMNFLETTKDAGVDVAYIGHCFNGNCTHALAVTPEGARKVLQLVDWCQPNKGTNSPEGKIQPVDEILRKYCAADKLLDEDIPNGKAPPQGTILKCAYAPNINTSPKNKKIAWANGVLRQYKNFHPTHN